VVEIFNFFEPDAASGHITEDTILDRAAGLGIVYNEDKVI